MSDFRGVFEVLAADDSDVRLASRRALVLSENRINERLGSFLGASKSADEFDARLSYVEDHFKGIIAVACEEVGHGNPQAIYSSLRAHYRPVQPRTASVIHEARRPKMCPYHSEVVDISLGAGDPKAGYDVMQSHAWGTNHCQGDWEGKCNFKREMVSQSYWDDRQKALDEQREERQQAVSPVPEGVEEPTEDDVSLSEPSEPIGEVEETPEGSNNVIDFPSPDGMVDNGGSAIAEPMALAASLHEADDEKGVCQSCDGEGCPGCAFTGKGYPKGKNQKEIEESDAREKESRTAENNPSNQSDDSNKSVPCPECGGDGKTNGGKECPRCKGQGHVSDWGPSTLDAVGSSVKTADNGKGNTGLGGPEPVIDERKWTPQNVRKVEVPSDRHPTKEKDPIDPIKAVNDDDLTEIGEKTTERVELPTAGENLDDSGFAGNNQEQAPGTKTWTGTEGQANPVTTPTISKADDVERNPIRDLLTEGYDGFVSPSVIARVTGR